MTGGPTRQPGDGSAAENPRPTISRVPKPPVPLAAVKAAARSNARPGLRPAPPPPPAAPPAPPPRPDDAEPTSDSEPRPDAEARPDALTGTDTPAGSAGEGDASATAPEGAGGLGGPGGPQAGRPLAPGQRPVRPLPVNPRRVRGGIRLKNKEGEGVGWVAARVRRLMELGAAGEALREGLDYAAGGQTKRLDFEVGRVSATVQGRRPKPYETVLSLPAFGPAEAERIVAAMADQAKYAAKLLSGELPPNIEDVFAPLGLQLLPTDPADVKTECSCFEPKPWCKHAVCVAAIAAERLGADPFLIFGWHGLPGSELVDRLRDHRVLAGQSGGAQAVHQAHVPGVTDTAAVPLDAMLDRFWAVGGDLSALDLPLAPPPVSHPLLRRLGASPFTEGKFPLVGLLATCYSLISERTLREALDDGSASEGGEAGAGGGDEAPDGADGA